MNNTKVSGKCIYMCPTKEIKLRERENLLHPFEVARDHTPRRPRADFEKCVKEYSRPTVGKQEIDPEDLRPPGVLVGTADYLIDRIGGLNTRWSDIYDFVFDRLRAIRQDFVIQDYHGYETIQVLEKAVRFHVYSDYRLCTEHISLFDQKINDQHTQECLKRLINLYKNSDTSCDTPCDRPCDIELDKSHDKHCKRSCESPCDRSHDNRVELETTYLLFNLGEEAALKHYYSLDTKLRHHPSLQQAYEMSCAYIHNNWVRMFRLIRSLSHPVHLCTLHRHFTDIQRRALYTLNSAYSSKNLKFPLDKLTELLFLNTDTETQHICEKFGITIAGTSAQFLKTNFRSSEQIERSHNDYITARVKEWTVPELLHGRIQLEELSSDFRKKCQT